MPQDNDGEQCAYGDVDALEGIFSEKLRMIKQYEYGDVNTSDFSHLQFFNPDETLDNGKQYEYGDVDTLDFSPHQFFDPDEALAAEEFDSVDVPSSEDFKQNSNASTSCVHSPTVHCCR